VFVVQLPYGAERDGVIRDLAARGVQSKPYLPAIHLMSFYRERFGHRPGEFPVCEDVAARSLALPFFPGLEEGQVARVAAGLRRALGR
jgi:perosamine synthetase